MRSIDVRTRHDGDVHHVEPAEFCQHDLPSRLAETGPLAARGASHLGLPPLTVVVDSVCFTFRPDGMTVEVVGGADQHAVVVTLGLEAFSDWVQEVRTLLALLVGGDATVLRGSSDDAIAWDTVMRAMVDARPVHEPGAVPLLDRSGAPLDLARGFRPDDDRDEMGWFLQQAGFLRLSGWLEPAEVDALSRDIEGALTRADPDDPHTWWATMTDGSRRCVRMKHFDELSDNAARLVASDVLGRVRSTTDDSLPLPAAVVEGLMKPAGVVEGVSDLGWHKDCWQGRHAYRCCGLTIGVVVTPADDRTGFLRVLTGSHRASLPATPRAATTSDLPTVDLHGDVGDLTVHLSCTLHKAVPPLRGERRVLYAGFALEGKAGSSVIGSGLRIRHAEWAAALASWP